MTDFGEWPVWHPDGQRLLFVFEGERFYELDVASGQTREVFSVARDVIGPPRIAGDGTHVYFSRRVTEADLWLATITRE